jgi:hypothetical protein
MTKYRIVKLNNGRYRVEEYIEPQNSNPPGWYSASGDILFLIRAKYIINKFKKDEEKLEKYYRGMRVKKVVCEVEF